MTIYSFENERRKAKLLGVGVGVILLSVLWQANILFQWFLSDNTVIADSVPELLTYITISALFGLVGAIFTAFRCPSRDALKHITKAFGYCFFYDVYIVMEWL